MDLGGLVLLARKRELVQRGLGNLWVKIKPLGLAPAKSASLFGGLVENTLFPEKLKSKDPTH